jgi:hypothetical protein
VLTGRDVEVVRWVGRHGVVSTDQVAERFWRPETSGWTVRRRLGVLVTAGLLRAGRPGWRRQSKLWLATASGLRWTGLALRPARLISWRLDHDLALVDLSEELLAENAAASWLTERELAASRTISVRLESGQHHRPDGLLRLPDGRRYAVELEASRKTAERLRGIVSAYVRACRGRDALTGVLWYARPELGASVAHVQAAIAERGTARDFEIREWRGRNGRV